jgi:hypothetical protein
MENTSNPTRPYTKARTPFCLFSCVHVFPETAGLDDLAALVHKYTQEPSSYSPTEMRACLDGFKDVLFSHLDEEVNVSQPIDHFSHYITIVGCGLEWQQLEEVLHLGGGGKDKGLKLRLYLVTTRPKSPTSKSTDSPVSDIVTFRSETQYDC